MLAADKKTDCGTYPIVCAHLSGISVIFMPSIRTAPCWGISKPSIISTSVDFPDPEDPIKAIELPFFIVNDTFSKTFSISSL